MRVYLRQLQGSHDSSEAKHIAHCALELSSDLDDFMKQAGSFFGRPRAAQHVHSQHDRHGLKPAGMLCYITCHISPYSDHILLKEVLKFRIRLPFQTAGAGNRETRLRGKADIWFQTD